ncbi:MAG: hypothetical protein IPG50_09685 [Myxococcales bacterium]|nr:hypothetical protein [Myxococcales bacterium]
MRRGAWVGLFSTLSLFAACGDERDVVIPPLDESDGGAQDGSMSQDGASSNDAGVNDSEANDTGASDTAVSDAPRDASTDADGSRDGTMSDGAGDGASSDANSDAPDARSDAPTHGDAGTDAATDSGIPQVLLLDEAFGANTYGGGLNAAGNWVTSGTLVATNAGTQWFGSGNGSNNTFFNLYFKKALGGVVENRPYAVSFYVVLPEDGSIQPIELSDFSVLRIGGPTGSVNWTSTPSPTVSDVWVKWTGTYTPSLADVGGPFFFEMKFDLPSMHSVGVDGPIGIE